MKKFKLISTIASLCLAVALMAFGVYAATSVSVKITSNISFSAKDNVSGTLTVKSYNIADYTEAEQNQPMTKPTLTGVSAVESFTQVVNNNTGTLTVTDSSEADVTIKTNSVFVVYEVSFKSSTSDDPTLKVDSVSIKNNNTDVSATGESAKVKVINGLDNNQGVSSKNEAKHYIVIKILDTSADFTYNVEFTVSITSTANNT